MIRGYEELVIYTILALCTEQLHAQTLDPIPPQNLWWILVGAIGGPLVILLLVFLCCYFNCLSKRFQWRHQSKISTVVQLENQVAESEYQQQIENLLKSHHKECDCDSCNTSGHHKNCPCVRCGNVKQVLSHKHAGCLSCSVSLLHGSKQLLCSCEVCRETPKHQEDSMCPCNLCEVAQSHEQKCQCGECGKLTQHRLDEKWCNCIGCQDARVHDARLKLKHLQTCHSCRIATLHAQQTHCTCEKCQESSQHTAQYACQCRLCQEAVTHSQYLLCKCDSCMQEEIVPPVGGAATIHQIQNGCMCDKCTSKRGHRAEVRTLCDRLPITTNYCPEHQGMIMKRFVERRRRSSDSGIVEVDSLCQSTNHACPAILSRPLILKNCKQPCATCERCGGCHVHGKRGRSRSMSEGSTDVDTSMTRTLRKSSSTDCVNKEISSCNTSTTSIGVQASRPTRIHWRPHSNPMLTQSIHVFDREKYWKLKSDYVNDVKARREAYRNKRATDTEKV